MRLDVRVSPGGSRRTSIEGGVLRVGGADAAIDCEQIADDLFSLRSEIRLKDPRLWWPHTHGQPYSYGVEATLRADVEERIDLGRVAFRTVHVDRGHDTRGFGLVVNGTPVFCRGVCWTPIDLASLSGDPASYWIALEQLRDAGMNMVRVAGTTAYETDTFYHVCDQLGLMVWQDFMFANMDYPWQDEAFAETARLEAAQVLETLQSHASLAVVCGSSEVDQQAAMLGLPLGDVSAAAEHPLADLVHAAVPDVVWLPTTPTGGTLPFQVDTGVSHYFGVGAYRRPFDDARRAQVRFAAECLAFSNIPEPARAQPPAALDEDWKRRVPRDAGADWDFEDVRDYYVEQLFDVRATDIRSADPDRYLALGRVATGEAMLRTFAEWRRPGSSCRGGLVWFARDFAPGPGWGVIDSTARPKSVYWYLKRAFAPIALLPADEGLNGLWLHAMNDSPGQIEGELRVALYKMGRACGQPISVPLDVSPRSARSIHVDGLFNGFRDLTYAYRFGPPQHDVVSMTLVDRSTGMRQAAAWYFPVHLPSAIDLDLQMSAEIESAGDGHAVVLGASRFAHAVAIDIDGFVPDDNYFCLEPGEQRRVSLIASDRAAVRIPEGRVTALNSPRPCPVVSHEVVDAG
jgi:beta-mannosidase